MIIKFFRDILDGPLYIVMSFICFVLLVICTLYLFRDKWKKKATEEVEAVDFSSQGNIMGSYTTGTQIDAIIQNDTNSYSKNVYSDDKK